MPARKTNGKRKKPIKLLVFGDSGVGKTHFLLSAPKALVCDTEGGTDLFEGRKGFNFSVWEDDDGCKTTSVKETRKAMSYIQTAQGRKDYETFCVDPYSAIWDDIQIQRQDYKETKRKYSTDNEADVTAFTQSDWMVVKRLHKSIVIEMVNLPANVIVACREKEVVETLPNGDMKKTGEYTYDGEKNMKYLFDIVLRIFIDPKTKVRKGIIVKSRSEFIQEGQVFENPTFAIFDEIINSQKGAKEAATPLSLEVKDNVFTEADEANDYKKVVVEATTKLRSMKEKLSPEQQDEILASCPKNNPNNIKTLEEAQKYSKKVELYFTTYGSEE